MSRALVVATLYPLVLAVVAAGGYFLTRRLLDSTGWLTTGETTACRFGRVRPRCRSWLHRGAYVLTTGLGAAVAILLFVLVLSALSLFPPFGRGVARP